MSPISRRVLLTGSAAGAAGLAVGAWVGRETKGPGSQSPTESVDVAIVGAGIAGLYVADRLAASGQHAPVVFEASSRPGGRLWSEPVPDGPDGQVAELGGMRIPLQHNEVLDLVADLGLDTGPFPSTTPESLVFLRGTRVRAGDVQRVDQFPYRFAADLGALGPESLLGHITAKVGAGSGLQGITDESGSWGARLSLDGRPLHTLSTVELLTRTLGNDGAQFMSDWSGYDVPALAASSWLGALYSFSGECVTVRGGLEQIPRSLAERATSRGAQVRFGEELVGLQHDGSSFALQLLSSGSTQVHSVRARSVVLAVPPVALRMLARSGDLLRRSERLSAALGQVVESQAAKVFLTYERPWWTELGIGTGRSVSDTLLRQTFYLTADNNSRAMLLASYAFGDVPADLLAGLAPEATAGQPATITPDTAAPVTRALSQMHGIDVPPPIGGAVQRWAELAGAAVPLWGPGRPPWDLAAAVSTPVDGLPLYVCGDSMSLNQGWMLGAIQTAQTVLMDGFGL